MAPRQAFRPEIAQATLEGRIAPSALGFGHPAAEVSAQARAAGRAARRDGATRRPTPFLINAMSVRLRVDPVASDNGPIRTSTSGVIGFGPLSGTTVGARPGFGAGSGVGTGTGTSIGTGARTGVGTGTTLPGTGTGTTINPTNTGGSGVGTGPTGTGNAGTGTGPTGAGSNIGPGSGVIGVTG